MDFNDSKSDVKMQSNNFDQIELIYIMHYIYDINDYAYIYIYILNCIYTYIYIYNKYTIKVESVRAELRGVSNKLW